MPFKSNYHQEHASRERAKNERMQEKLRKREAAAAERKAARVAPSVGGQTQTHDDQL